MAYSATAQPHLDLMTGHGGSTLKQAVEKIAEIRKKKGESKTVIEALDRIGDCLEVIAELLATK